jgi:hypothetical protein
MGVVRMCSCEGALLWAMWWFLVVVVGAVVDMTVVGMDTTVFFLGAVDKDVAAGVFADCFSREDLGEGGWSLEGLIAVIEEVVACQGGSR